jgi:hypothetical protein
MGAVDTRKSVASEKARNDAASVFTHDPLVPGSSRRGGTPPRDWKESTRRAQSKNGFASGKPRIH